MCAKCLQICELSLASVGADKKLFANVKRSHNKVIVTGNVEMSSNRTTAAAAALNQKQATHKLNKVTEREER